MSQVAAPRELYFLLATIQGVLLLAGLVLGVVSLIVGGGRPGTGVAPAILGLLLSGGTLALVAFLFLSRL
jgi:hypothetical protein